MSRRHPQPSPEETETFKPADPWWRKPPPPAARGAARPSQRTAARYPVDAPILGATQPPRVLKRARVSLRNVILIMMTPMILGGLITLLTDARFSVVRAGTEIWGAHRVTADTIYAASQIEGTNIFRLAPNQIADRIRQLPGIADTAVHVRLPNQVVIEVAELTPLVAWHSITSTTWLADNGRIIPISGDPPPLRLTDATGAANDGHGGLRPQILVNLKALQTAGLETNELFYGVQEGLYFRSPEGWTVYLGNEGQIAHKLTALQELRRNGVTQTMRSRIVDLRFDGRAQIR